MPTRLRKLKITRVAVCAQGANPDADILLFKSLTPVALAADPQCADEDCADADCPVHGLHKQEGPTVGDVYTETYAGTSRCSDPDCDDPHCPVHGALVRARRKKKPVAKGPVSEMGMHPEPDGDEIPPLDYRTRAQQYDLWESLWQKWQTFTTTFQDCCGDWDQDNVPHLAIFLDSIGQFQTDVADLLTALGIVEKVAPLFADLSTVSKAGAAMAGHRRKRLQDAIAALQQILEECTPEDLPHGILPPIDRAGVSAAEVAGFAGYMVKGDAAMADNSMLVSGNVAQETINALMKRAESAEARVLELEKVTKDLEALALQVPALEATIAKMKQTPEEQEAEYWASVPEPVRKKHEADEAEKVELRKQLEDARQEREQTVYISKTADYRGFGMVQKHWRILKAIDAIPDTEDRDELLRLMKASAARDQASELYRAAGSEGRYGPNGTVESASPSDQIMALTEAYMAEKGVDFLKASEVIAKSHRELYRRASEERRHASRVSTT